MVMDEVLIHHHGVLIWTSSIAMAMDEVLNTFGEKQFFRIKAHY